MDRYATIFKTLSDPTRLRILRMLLEARTELCVCELVDSLEQTPYNVSKHVKTLKGAGLLESRRDGRWIYYRAARAAEPFHALVHRAVAAIPEAAVRRDRAELRKRLRLREGGRCLRGVVKLHLLGNTGA